MNDFDLPPAVEELDEDGDTIDPTGCHHFVAEDEPGPEADSND